MHLSLSSHTLLYKLSLHPKLPIQTKVHSGLITTPKQAGVCKQALSINSPEGGRGFCDNLIHTVKNWKVLQYLVLLLLMGNADIISEVIQNLKKQNSETMCNKKTKVMKYEESWSDEAANRGTIRLYNQHFHMWTNILSENFFSPDLAPFYRANAANDLNKQAEKWRRYTSAWWW